MSELRHPTIPLKHMEAALLTLELTRLADRVLTPAGLDRVICAATAASHLHRDQTRAQRGDLPRVPYIEHPLRNTVRLLRWGARDTDLLCASLLHDVPEDCSDRAVQLYAHGAPGTTRVEQTLAWIRDGYGARVAQTVAAVTNPPRQPGTTEEQRMSDYADHVRRAVENDTHALLVKASDLTDNAGSLPHQTAGVDPTFIAKRLHKYTPVVALVRKQLDRAAESPTIDGDVAVSASRAIGSLERSLASLASRTLTSDLHDRMVTLHATQAPAPPVSPTATETSTARLAL